MYTVAKYGGAILAHSNRWEKIFSQIVRYHKPIIVVSAIGKTTAKLYDIARYTYENRRVEAIRLLEDIFQDHIDLIRKFSFISQKQYANIIDQINASGLFSSYKAFIEDFISFDYSQFEPLLDCIYSWGEYISAFLFVLCGKKLDIPIAFVDAKEIIYTDGYFGNANPDWEAITKNSVRLKKILDKGIIPVIGGFYGRHITKGITTLGIEGSDYTATILASVLRASKIDIWKLCKGVHLCDPQMIENPPYYQQLNYEDAKRIFSWGIKLIHSKALQVLSESSCIQKALIRSFDYPSVGTYFSHGPTKPHYNALSVIKLQVIWMSNEQKPIGKLMAKTHKFSLYKRGCQYYAFFSSTLIDRVNKNNELFMILGCTETTYAHILGYTTHHIVYCWKNDELRDIFIAVKPEGSKKIYEIYFRIVCGLYD